MDPQTNQSPRIHSRLKTKALRILTLTVTKLATQRCISKLFTHSSGTILYLDFCIKFGDSVTLAEANALQFIAGHTSIPVPKVHHAFTHHGRTYILMERIRGETIAKRWYWLSDASSQQLSASLNGWSKSSGVYLARPKASLIWTVVQSTIVGFPKRLPRDLSTLCPISIWHLGIM